MRKTLLKLPALLMAIILLITPMLAMAQETGNEAAAVHSGALAAPVITVQENSYALFLAEHERTPRPAGEIIINTGGVHAGEFDFYAPQAGLYNLQVTYQAVEGRVVDIETRLLINGEAQHRNGEMFILPRMWINEPHGTGEARFALDMAGNEVRPRQLELFETQTRFITDPLFQFSGPLYFYLQEGHNTLTLTPQMEYAYFYELRFAQAPAAMSYAQYRQAGRNDSSGHRIRVEAELADVKNSINLFPTYDRGREAMSPSHYRLRRYNTIGNNTWHRPGQEITYYADIPQDGYYHLAFKARQSEKRGMFSTRAVYINGELPFAELGNVRFPHQASWFVLTPEAENGEPLRVFLTAGTHEITIASVLGDEEALLREAEALVAELNFWYRRIIAITGSNADAERITIDLNRDFRLDQRIPGMIDAFAQLAVRLDTLIADANALYGRDGSAATMMAELATQLRAFVVDPDRIPARLQHYIDSISSIATWALDMRSQPLEMDWFEIFSPDLTPPRRGGNFFRQLWYRFRMFLASFSSDFHSVGTTEEGIPTIEVWVSLSDISAGTVAAGRDQANIIRQLIDRYFTPQYGVGVEISLIQGSGVLMQAIVAGRGPDAAVFASRDIPVNLAMRNALEPLDGFPGFDEITQRFRPGAMIPYEYNGRTFALPETQSFDMLFYRRDIFDELGLSVPDTWDEFYFAMSVMQQNNILAGIPESVRMFESLLFQNGIGVFTPDLQRTTFDQPEALNAFRQWTGFYAQYSLPLVFDFFNRFRNGQMAMAIVPYTQANYLAGAAPDINGLWGFAPIPGTVQPDGSINRATSAMGSGAVMVRKPGRMGEQRDSATSPSDANYDMVWDFLTWWTSADMQAQFALDQEQMMGAAARYPTANAEAFSRLPWTTEQMDALLTQWEHVREIPQVPGGYFIHRHLSFAFRNVVLDFANERDTLRRHNREINSEIRRRRIEFGLPVE